MDFLLDDQNNLKIENGDFVIADATVQMVKRLLVANQGEFKEEVLTGVGMDNFLNEEHNITLLGIVNEQLEFNDLKASVEIQNGEIKIEV